MEGEGTMKKKQKLESDSEVDRNLCMADFDTGERIGNKEKTSNFTRKKVSEIQVIPEECKVEFDEEEEKYYNSDVYKNRRFRRATKAEMKCFQDASRKSQGFDIPLLPGVCQTPIHRVNLSIEPAAVQAARLSKLALNWYNGANGTRYVLQHIVKSTGKPCAYVVYCITFMASENSGPAETFQARVWVKFNFDVHIMMCRKKGDPDPDPYNFIDFNFEDDDDDESQEDDDDDDDDDDEDNDESQDDNQPQPQHQEDDQP